MRALHARMEPVLTAQYRAAQQALMREHQNWSKTGSPCERVCRNHSEYYAPWFGRGDIYLEGYTDLHVIASGNWMNPKSDSYTLRWYSGPGFPPGAG